MTLTYKETVVEALSLAENIEDIVFIEQKITTTPKINRRTKDGRELTKELLTLLNERTHDLIERGMTPF